MILFYSATSQRKGSQLVQPSWTSIVKKKDLLDGSRRRPKIISISTMRPSSLSARLVQLLSHLADTIVHAFLFWGFRQILQNDQWSGSVKEEDADKLELNGKGGTAGGDKKKSGCCWFLTLLLLRVVPTPKFHAISCQKVY